MDAQVGSRKGSTCKAVIAAILIWRGLWMLELGQGKESTCKAVIAAILIWRGLWMLELGQGKGSARKAVIAKYFDSERTLDARVGSRKGSACKAVIAKHSSNLQWQAVATILNPNSILRLFFYPPESFASPCLQGYTARQDGEKLFSHS